MAEDPSLADSPLVYLDSNIVLECKPLHELPWDELGLRYPFCLAFVPQVLKEVDSKKQDGRLYKRAREFNRLLTKVATSSHPMRLPDAKGDIYLTIVGSGRIDWDGVHANEDPGDFDTRVVLEILNAKVAPSRERLFVSNDIKPIWLAGQYGIRVFHAGDAWRRPPEPSPHDKEVQKLKQRVAELEATQPKLAVAINVDLAGFKRFAVRPPEPSEKERLVESFLARNPPPRRVSRGILDLQLEGFSDDVVTQEAYEEFQDSLPEFADKYAELLELEYGQCPFQVTISNTGPLRAQNLILKIQATSGWLNVRPVLIPLRGPTPRRSRRFSPLDLMPKNLSGLGRVGRHEMHIVETPERGPSMEVHCEDFPAGASWTFEGYFWIDPRAAQPKITARVTAANLHGTLDHECGVQVEIEEANISDLLDFDGLSLRSISQISQVIQALFAGEHYDDVDLLESASR
jgi:hypothetical protein